MRLSPWIVAVVLVAGCGGSNKPPEGPAERAGKSVDNAAEKTKDKAEDTKDDVKEKAHDVKEDVKDHVNTDTN